MIAVQSALLFLLCGIAQCQEEHIYHVGGPRSWTVGVPEAVTVEAVGHEESFPVQLSLLSYPDKKVTYDSQQLQLSSSNRYRGSLSLLIRPEDFPSREEEEKFVYLVAESDGSIKEMKIGITDHRTSLPALETKQASKRLKRQLEKEIELKASTYRVDSVKQCCRDGSAHYRKQWECYKRLAEIKSEQRLPCAKAFEVCCTYVKNHYQKKRSISGGRIQPSYCVTVPRSWIVGEPQKFTAKVYRRRGGYVTRVQIYRDENGTFDSQKPTIVYEEKWGDADYLASLLSYPDKNVTFDTQKLIFDEPYSLQEHVTLLVKEEDLPRGQMEKFAYLVFDSYIEMQVLLTRQRGNCTYHNQRYKSYKTELEMQSAALEDLEFDEDIWRDVDSHVDAESNDEFDFRVDVHNGAYPFTFADPHKAPYFAVHDKINSKVEAWINLQSNTEAWRDLESRNRAWTDLQSNMTALAAKHKSKEAQQACWRGYQDYLFHWRCPERLRESPILEKIEEKAKRKCCFYTRKYLHNLLATGQVTLGNAEHCRY